MSTDLAARERTLLRALGLARRAGGVSIGTRAVREAGASGRLRVILVARDAAPAVGERLRRLADRTDAVLLECGSRDELGAAVGRSPLASVGITDRRLAALFVGKR